MELGTFSAVCYTNSSKNEYPYCHIQDYLHQIFYFKVIIMPPAYVYICIWININIAFRGVI